MAPKIQHHLGGTVFGRLLVLRETDPYACVSTGTKSRQWKCVCDCGNIVDVRQSNLLSGKTKSCGCLKRRDANGLFCKAL